MTAFDNKSIHTARKSLFQGSRLLKVSAFAAVGLLTTQTVVAQTESGTIELTIPQPAAEAPIAQPSRPVTSTPAPTVIEPVTPNSIVPTSIETTPSAEAADYGTVFIEPDKPAAPTLESLLENEPANISADATPEVEVISPTDYSTGLIDTTEYSVGATVPDVVISERSSGCEFSVEAGKQVANAGCGQLERLATTLTNGVESVRTQASASTSAAFNISGLQFPGTTTAASRDYYNQATQPVVKLQLGQTFIFPLSIPASLTSLFGWRIHPIFGDQRFHAGTDLGAPLGTPVVATQAGRVTLSDKAGGYGLMVILRHNDDTLESRYAHLSRLLVQAGEWVEQGEVVGLVGSTGNSTGPHLHFELRQLTQSGWVVLNPDLLLKQTLGTLAQALGNSLLALSVPDSDVSENKDAVSPLQGLPFRPAQPHAN